MNAPSRILGVALAGCIAGTIPSAGQALQCAAPLGEAAIKELVAAGVPAARLRNLIGTCGLDLRITDGASIETRLAQLGVPAAALAALAPPTDATAGARWISPIDRREMVFVAAGQFRMGSDTTESGRDADEASHIVTLGRGFWVDTNEVTNQAYQRFVLSRPEWQKGSGSLESQSTNYLKDWVGTNYPDGAANAPVVWVNWHAARAFAEWAGRRLPTEAEWEYAARAGTGTRYWWGAEFDARRVDAGPRPPTGSEPLSLRTNPWGLRDSLGGVWEWTQSLYRPYPYLPADGREETRAAGARVIRGGSRANGEAFLRSANRNAEEPVGANDLLGFRTAR